MIHNLFVYFFLALAALVYPSDFCSFRILFFLKKLNKNINKSGKVFYTFISKRRSPQTRTKYEFSYHKGSRSASKIQSFGFSRWISIILFESKNQLKPHFPFPVLGTNWVVLIWQGILESILTRMLDQPFHNFRALKFIDRQFRTALS